MAKYKYSCTNCSAEVEYSLSIALYLELKNSDHFNQVECSNCGEVCEFKQVFGTLSSKIKKDKQTIMSEVKDEARKIANKVRSGDSRTIRNIYGEN